MNFIRAAAAVLAIAVLVVGILAYIAVLVLGTWWAIRIFIAGDIIKGILVLFATPVAMAIIKAVFTLVGDLFRDLAVSGDHGY